MDRGVYTGETVKQVTTAGEEVHIRHGRGSYVYPGGCMAYVGDWVLGVKHGRGIFSVGTGIGHSVYEGDFIRGEMSGTGLKRWADGATYTGRFEYGEPNGQGEWLSHGAKYEGEWRDGARHGQGTLTVTEGHSYSGEWAKSQRHGSGTLRWADGSSYTGTWRFDRCEGKGTHEWSDGSIFAGHFHSGQRSGDGTYTHVPTGISIRGKFERDRPQVTPQIVKLRVVDTEATSNAAAAGSSSSSGDKSRPMSGTHGSKDGTENAPSPPATVTRVGSGSKLSKKKLDELRRLEQEQAEYRATLTRGEVTLDDGSTLQLIDEALQQVIVPGKRLPTFYLCACSPTGVVASTEHGRVLQISLRSAPVPTPTQSESITSGRKSATASISTTAVDPADEPIVAFCTCEGAKTVEWVPKPVEQESVEPTGSGRKKKSSSSKSSASSSKRRKSSVAEIDGPPPPFVCDGTCTSSSDRSAHLTVMRRTLKRGFAIFDDIWLSGACTPGHQMELSIEDATPNVIEQGSDSIHQQRQSTLTNSTSTKKQKALLEDPPPPITFTRLVPFTLKILADGVPAKQKKKAPLPKNPLTNTIGSSSPPSTAGSNSP